MKTMFQKIIEQHLLKVFPDGSMLLKLDLTPCHEITTPNAILDMQEKGCDVVFDPNRILTMIDHVSPACTTQSAVQGQIMRRWSWAHGIEFLDVGHNGICHAVIPEMGRVLPGQVMIMGDSHTCTLGALGALAAGVGTTDLEAGIITGFWVCPPQRVIRVNFTGNLPANVFSKDLILALIAKIGVKGATNAILEFGGPVINGMSMEARMTISNMAVEAGATCGMMAVDMTTVRYLLPALRRIYGDTMPAGEILCNLKRWNSDPSASYDKVIDVDVSTMVPVTTYGYSPANVMPVSELAATQADVDQVVIGSCTNGRLEDLRIAAKIFQQEKAKVSDKVRCIVIPATQYIFQRALKEGLIETFLDAGCSVSSPTCGPCLGMSCGVIAPREVCASTTNRNFDGRMGEGGMIRLMSPATAAITAIQGRITEPSIGLCHRVLNDMRIDSELQLKPADSVRLTGWPKKEFDRPDYRVLTRLFDEKEVEDFSGRAFYLPTKDINTDQIIKATFLNEVNKRVMGDHCLEIVVTSPKDRKRMCDSQILVAGENFGCGSSREHAAWAFQGIGIRCIIAPSFARIFQTNMFAVGLLCITLPKDRVEFLLKEKPEYLTIDWEYGPYGTVRWGDHGAAEERFKLTELQKKLIKKGGSVGVMIEMAAELQAEGQL